jgi:hypothetical protein
VRFPGRLSKNRAFAAGTAVGLGPRPARFVVIDGSRQIGEKSPSTSALARA